MKKPERRRGKVRQAPIVINSVAQGRLIELLQQEKLRSFAAENGVGNYLYLYQIAVGERSPSRSYIYALRHIIQPSDWYTERDSVETEQPNEDDGMGIYG